LAIRLATITVAAIAAHARPKAKGNERTTVAARLKIRRGRISLRGRKDIYLWIY
jgi:hypothetical protein